MPAADAAEARSPEARPAADGSGPPADAPGPDAPDAPGAPDAPAPIDSPPVACQDSTTCGTCQRCQNGTCVPIARGDADESAPTFCRGDQLCDGQGTCRSTLGQVCGASDDCLSGFCRSSVCCDSDCAGSCRHCNLPERAGTCVDATGPSYAIGCAANGEICVAANRCLGPDQSCMQQLPVHTTHGAPIAQTFTVGRNGRLVAVRLSLICEAGQAFTLEIHSVTGTSPEGRLLGSQILRGPTPFPDAADERWLVPLATPIAVRTGDRMSMIVRFQGTQFCSVSMTRNFCYPEGQLFTYGGDPASWSADPDSDLGFRTYVVE